MKNNARLKALMILNDIEMKGSFSHNLLGEMAKEDLWSPLDRRFINHLVTGVLNTKIRLDFYIRKFSKQRFSRIDKRTVNVLRMGFYQLEYMHKVPDSAAVNESVDLAKKISSQDAKFVNGILRAFIREGKNVDFPDEKKHPYTSLSVKFSTPEWLVKLWVDAYGFQNCLKILEVQSKQALLSVRVNTMKITVDDLKEQWAERGVELKGHPLCEEAIIITQMNGLMIDHLPGYKEGFFQIQDVSSMCVAEISGLEPHSFVIDVCSAPGGKITHLYQKIEGEGHFIARDLSDLKCKLIEENVNRLCFDQILVEKWDAMQYDESKCQKADLVLADVPCSGLGIIRRKPDIKYNKSLEDIQNLCDLQYGILQTSSQYVKREGTLIYSTCTLNPKENEEIIYQFLKNNPDFKLQPFELKTGEKSEGMMTLYPYLHDTDGFFIAKLSYR